MSIALGLTHSCAVLTEGSVTCWGKNNAGQLRNDSTDDWYVPGDEVVGLILEHHRPHHPHTPQLCHHHHRTPMPCHYPYQHHHQAPLLCHHHLATTKNTLVKLTSGGSGAPKKLWETNQKLSCPCTRSAQVGSCPKVFLHEKHFGLSYFSQISR